MWPQEHNTRTLGPSEGYTTRLNAMQGGHRPGVKVSVGMKCRERDLVHGIIDGGEG